MRPYIEPRRLWFGLLAAPFAWSVQGLLGWFFGARICTQMSIGSVRTIVGLIGIVALAVAVGGLLVGIGNWRVAVREERVAEDRVEFMSLGGVLVSGAFVLGTFWGALNAVFINVCGGAR